MGIRTIVLQNPCRKPWYMYMILCTYVRVWDSIRCTVWLQHTYVYETLLDVLYGYNLTWRVAVRSGKLLYRRMVERYFQNSLPKEGTSSYKTRHSECIDVWWYCVHIYRHIARFCESYMRGVASKAMTSIEQLLNNQVTKFTNFEVLKSTRRNLKWLTSVCTYHRSSCPCFWVSLLEVLMRACSWKELTWLDTQCLPEIFGGRSVSEQFLNSYTFFALLHCSTHLHVDILCSWWEWIIWCYSIEVSSFYSLLISLTMKLMFEYVCNTII